MAHFPLPSNEGVIKRVAGTDQAANTEFLDTVPAGKWWMLFCVSVQLVQGGTQTPWPSLVIDDGSNVIFKGFAGTAAMNVSTTSQITWAPNLQPLGAAASTATFGPLPDGLCLPAGYRIGSLTTGIGANTNYGAPSYFVCELG